MCFTPHVSLAIALIEFVIVIYLFKKINDKRLRALPFFVLFLGVYQLTEFFLCTTNNELWAKLGFISYTMLPVLMMQFFYDLSKIKLNKLFYSVPLAYILLALLHPQFVISATCESFYINVRNLFFWGDRALLWIYLIYYGLFPLLGYTKVLKSKDYDKENWKLKTAMLIGPFTLVLAQGVLILIMLKQLNYPKNGIIASLVLLAFSLIILYLGFIRIRKKLFKKILATVVFSSVFSIYIIYLILPGIGLSFASIYCHFALLYSIASILFVEAVQD